MNVYIFVGNPLLLTGDVHRITVELLCSSQSIMVAIASLKINPKLLNLLATYV